MDPDDAAALRIVADDGMSREQQLAALESLPAPAGMSAGMSLAPPVESSPAPMPEAPPMSIGAPAESMAMTPAPAPVLASSAPVEAAPVAAPAAAPAPGVPPSMSDAYMRASALSAMAPRPGYMQRGGEFERGRVVEQAAPRDPALVEAQQEGVMDQAAQLAGAADRQANLLELDAQRAKAQAQRERDAAAKAEAARRLEDEHIAAMTRDHEARVADAVANPPDFWRDASAGQQVSAVIAAFALGLVGKPEVVANMIGEMNGERLEAQRFEIAQKKEPLERARERQIQPEAWARLQEAQALRVAAAESEELAKAAAAEETRARGIALAQSLLAEARARELAAQQAEAGSIRRQIEITQDRYVGGGGGDAGLREWAKARGIKYEDAVKIVMGEREAGVKELTAEQERGRKSEIADIERRVRIPEGLPGAGNVVYAKDSAVATDTQGQLTASAAALSNLDKIRALIDQGVAAGVTDRISKEFARLQTLVSDNTVNYKTKYKLGVIAGPDMTIIEPVSGASATKFFANPDAARAQVDEAKAMLLRDVAAAGHYLTNTPLGADFSVSPGGTAPIAGLQPEVRERK